MPSALHIGRAGLGLGRGFAGVDEREGTYPPAPLFASLIVGYACAYEERGVKLF